MFFNCSVSARNKYRLQIRKKHYYFSEQSKILLNITPKLLVLWLRNSKQLHFNGTASIAHMSAQKNLAGDFKLNFKLKLNFKQVPC